MFAKLASPFREFGPLGGLLYLADRALSRVSPRCHVFDYELMVQPIPDQPSRMARLLKSIEIREIRRGDAELDLMPRPPEVLEARLGQGSVCLGAFQKGELIGYMWFCPRAYEEDEVPCTYVLEPEGEAVFDYDIYIYPPHRLGLAFMALWEGANAHLRERGVRYSFSRLSNTNVGSRAAHDHLGWKSVGRAVFVRLWRLTLMAATVSPFLDVSIRKSARTRIRVRPDALHAGDHHDND